MTSDSTSVRCAFVVLPGGRRRCGRVVASLRSAASVWPRRFLSRSCRVATDAVRARRALLAACRERACRELRLAARHHRRRDARAGHLCEDAAGASRLRCRLGRRRVGRARRRAAAEARAHHPPCGAGFSDLLPRGAAMVDRPEPISSVRRSPQAPFARLTRRHGTRITC